MSVKSPMILNIFQRTVLENYCDGEFSYLAEDAAIDIDGVEDTLLKFLLVELSTQEDCETVADAKSRLRTVAKDIDVAIRAMMVLEIIIDQQLAQRKLEAGA